MNDVNEVGLLGQIVFVVGQGSGSDSALYGYDSGSYGSLTSGDFPRGLFDDDMVRTVEAIYETADAEWVLEYSGGTANDWLSDEDALDAITVTVTYDDDVDTRAFVVGGFIETVGSNNRMVLEPPLPSRDWSDHDTETVTMAFHRHAGAAATIIPAALTGPAAQSGSFIQFVKDTTPGGPVMVQSLIVIMVYAAFIFKTKATPRGMIAAAVVLVLTPWVPAFFDFGDPIGASIVFVNVVLGAYAYRAFAASPP